MSRTSVKIEYVTDLCDLYCKYDGQTRPQDAFIELDPIHQIARAAYDPEIGGAVPMDVYHGIVQRWHFLFVPTSMAANRILQDCQELFESICQGCTEHWIDGNRRATFDYAAQAAISMIECIVAECVDLDDLLNVWEAGDYLACCPDESLDMHAGSTDEELADLAESIERDASNDGIDMLLGLEDELTYRREKLQMKRGI